MIIPLAKLIDDGYDMVAGNRFGGKISHMPFKRRLGNHLINCFITILTGKRVRDATTGLRFWKKDAFEKLDLRSKRFEIEVEMVTKTVGRGYRYIEVPISYSKRAGRSKLRFLSDGIRFVLVIAASRVFLI
jgi:hypothetical protein